MGFAFTPTRLNDLVVDVSLSGVAHGDILYRGASKWNNLAPGNAGDVLTSGGAGASPSWSAAAGGAPFDDATAIVKGSVDATKLLRFEVDGFTAGATRVLTPPDQNGTIALLERANTFTVGPQTITPAVAEKGLVISMNSSSSANAVEIQRSSGTTSVFVMDNACRAVFGTTSPSSGAILTVQSSSSFTTALRLQVANSTEFLLKAGGDGLISVDATGITGGRWVIQNDGKVGFGAPTPTTRLHVSERSATTNSVVDVCTFGFNSTGTPAAGLGGSLVLTLESSTTEDTTAGMLSWEWVTATHASRAARGKLTAYDTAARECIRFEADGSVGRVGIGGAVDSSSTLNVIGKQTIQTGADATIGLNVVGNSTSQSAALIRLLSNNSTSAGLASLEWLSGTTARALSIAMSGDDGALRLRQSGTEYATLNINPGSSIGVGFSGTSSGPGISFTANGTGAIIFGSTVSTGAYTVDFGKRASDGAICTAGVYTANYGSWASILNSALTNTVGTYQTFRHRTTGTPAAGFGAGLAFTLNSSTTADQDAALFSTEWVTATHASRAARGKLTAYDTAARECIRIEASGSAPMVGFLGASAVVRQTGDIAVALENLGLVTAGTSLGPKYLMAAATLMAG